MRNMDKFIEVFGNETFDKLIDGLDKEEITVETITLWFMKPYGEMPKKRGRKPKVEYERA